MLITCVSCPIFNVTLGQISSVAVCKCKPWKLPFKGRKRCSTLLWSLITALTSIHHFLLLEMSSDIRVFFHDSDITIETRHGARRFAMAWIWPSAPAQTDYQVHHAVATQVLSIVAPLMPSLTVLCMFHLDPNLTAVSRSIKQNASLLHFITFGHRMSVWAKLAAWRSFKARSMHLMAACSCDSDVILTET